MKISTFFVRVEVLLLVLTVTSLLMTSCQFARVEITSRDQSFSKTLGQRLDLVCVVTGITDMEVLLGYKLSWGRHYSSTVLNKITSDAASYVINTNNVTSTGRMTSQLTIANVTYEDDGTFYCSWSVSFQAQAQQAVDYATVQVTGTPEILELEIDRRPVAGRDITVTCLARGNPEPTILWTDPQNRTFPPSGKTFTIETTVVSDFSVESMLTLYNLTQQSAGDYRCRANSRLGRDENYTALALSPWTSIADPVEGEMNPPVYDVINTTLGPVVLECFAYNVQKKAEIEWGFRPDTNPRQFYYLADNSSYYITSPSVVATYNSALNVKVSELRFYANFSSQGTYFCRSGNVWHNRSLHVQDYPKVTLWPDYVEAAFGDVVDIICTAEARPPPSYLYLTINSDILDSPSEIKINNFTYEIRTSLKIKSPGNFNNVIGCVGGNDLGESSSDFVSVEDKDECEDPDLCPDIYEYCFNTIGSYRCECITGFIRDFVGNCVNWQVTSPTTNAPRPTSPPPTGATDENKGKDNSNVALFAGAGAGGLLLIIIIIVVVIFVLRRRGKQRQEGPDDVEGKPKRERPQSAQIQHGTTIYSNPVFMPNTEAPIYTALRKDRSEFPRDQLRLMEGLGHGKFGMVVKAMALSIQSAGKWERVAVKGLKEASTDAEKSDLLRELTLLRSLPRHQNVVMFLGCCTLEDPAFIIMELCENGDLQTYLRQRRPDNRAGSPGNPYHDLKARDLFSFALHIARGMAHVAKEKIVHRDVASRNVLLTDRNVCKVSDFGLARRVGDDTDVYEIVSRRPLPIRWMSPESLRDGVHTTQSDVWSYGVLLWELVTLGSSPYPGKTGKAVIDLVIEGCVPLIPPQCTGELSAIMTSCWRMTPSTRPTFDDIARNFERLLEQEGDYLQLDHIEEGIYSIIEPSTSGERV